MGDSEDEYDRKRRDKFRGERTETYQRGESRRGPVEGDRRREEWVDRGQRNHARGDYREYRGAGRERYSPARTHDIVPPMKRMRTDWGEERRGAGYGHDVGGYGDSNYNSWQHGSYSQHSSYGSNNPSVSRGGAAEASETQPPMMSFKSYLITQDDNITDDDAIKKYNEYKLEFKRQQLNEFFVTHKDEEWFKTKYHPEEAVKRKDEQMTALSNRVKVYLEFLESGRQDKVSVDADKSEELIRLLDAVVIRLEGGTDFDLLALDEMGHAKENKVSSSDGNASQETHKSEKKDQDSEMKPEPDCSEDKAPAQEPPLTPELPVEVPAELGDVKVETEEKKRASSESGSESGDEPITTSATNGMDVEPAPIESDTDKAGNISLNVSTSLAEEGEEEEGEEKAESRVSNGAEDVSDKEETDKMDSTLDDPTEEQDKRSKSRSSSPEVSKPRSLHRTASIFLRNLAPTITRQEVETMCRRYPGFLRVAIADPQPERRWFRRGWVTFERQVNIKDICWNLNNIRLRDCELGAIVNRDLSRRIRTVNGITSHKGVVRNDIKLSARIVHNLDSRAGLWISPEEEKKEEKRKKKEMDDDMPNFNLSSKNPVLKNITDYLIEEASAEEDELLGLGNDNEEGQVQDTVAVYRDEMLIQVLDRLLLYLRIVHSVDYYNHCEYPNEDEMPNRCGIMHARGIPPSMKQLSQDEISDYCRTFEGKIASFLQPIPKITEEEYSKLGHKDPDAEVEKFVKANTQELAKDKWLCPLSGKKFKGPDFVRKHIFNKHTEKVDEVKKEVEYFNNYLRDPKRPQLAEHPGNRQRKEAPTEREGFPQPAHSYTPQQYGPGSYGYGGNRMSYGGGGGHGYGGGGYGGGYSQGYSRPRGGGFNRGRGGGAGEFRPVIHYRDLDAPREPEEFI